MQEDSFPNHGKAAQGEVGQSAPGANRINATEQETASFLQANYTLFREGTPTPPGGCSGKQSLPFAHMDLSLLDEERLRPCAAQCALCRAALQGCPILDTPSQRGPLWGEA